MNAHQLLDVFLSWCQLLAKWYQSEPLALVYIICVGASLASLIAAWRHCLWMKRLLKLLQGPVPTLNEAEKLRAFQEERHDIERSGSDAGLLWGVASVVSFIPMVLLYRISDDYLPLLFGAAGLLVFAGIVRIFGAEREANCRSQMDNRPELACLGYLDKLPSKPQDNKEDKLFWANLDDYVCAFYIGDQGTALLPMDQAEARALSEAQWQAINVDQPQTGELALLLWRSQGSPKVKVLVTKIKSVENAPADVQVSRPGRSLITVAGQKFCGGSVAHFCGTANEKIERGWMATASGAHVMLASLRWLDNNQRQYCYQLINPGKAYPASVTAK